MQHPHKSIRAPIITAVNISCSPTDIKHISRRIWQDILQVSVYFHRQKGIPQNVNERRRTLKVKDLLDLRFENVIDVTNILS